MDASIQEFIFGMLFSSGFRMKLTSNEKNSAKRRLPTENQPELVEELLEDKTSYGETFFVPKRARWHEPGRMKTTRLFRP